MIIYFVKDVNKKKCYYKSLNKKDKFYKRRKLISFLIFMFQHNL